MAADSGDLAFPVVDQVGTHKWGITGLYPFTLTHCGPSSPCVRFADAVTDADATLSTRCLATASGAGFCRRLTQPSFARRSNNVPFFPYWISPMYRRLSAPNYLPEAQIAIGSLVILSRHYLSRRYTVLHALNIDLLLT